MSNPWPDEYTRTTSSSWTLQYPRPEKGDGTSEVALKIRQEQWDASEALRQKGAKRVAEIHAEQEAKVQAQRDAAAAAQKARDEERLAALTKELRAGYFREPGATDEGFKAAHSDLLEARRRKSADAGDVAARQSQAALLRANF
jgi:hypothetical protein